MGIATFVYADWLTLFPALASVAEPTATALFNATGSFLDNTDCSPVQDVPTRTTILYYLTAHLAQLGINGANGQVGRLSEAREGTVSASFEFKGSENAAWWLQTGYGATAWQMLAGFRLGRYKPPPRPFCAIGPRGFRNGYSGW